MTQVTRATAEGFYTLWSLGLHGTLAAGQNDSGPQGGWEVQESPESLEIAIHLSGTDLRPNLWIHPEGTHIPFPENTHKVKVCRTGGCPGTVSEMTAIQPLKSHRKDFK